MPGISTTGLPATLFLAGPTGSGKSAVAVELAEMLGAEIVSSDAYQVYRELPILTAAPSPEDRARVPHHMVSIIPARMPWDATEHYHRAMRCVKDIHARGKTAIVTGGSGLYFKFLSHGMSEAPPGDAALRAAFADCSTEELHARLASLDPEGAAATDPYQPPVCGAQPGNRPCRRKTPFLLEVELAETTSGARLGHHQGCSGTGRENRPPRRTHDAGGGRGGSSRPGPLLRHGGTHPGPGVDTQPAARGNHP